MLFPSIRWISTLGALGLAAACTHVTCDCIGDPGVEVFSSGGAFVVHNRSAREVTVTLVVKGSLALIDGACERWEPRIPLGGELRVPNRDVIAFFESAETAVVWWCTLDGDAVRASGLIEVPFS